MFGLILKLFNQLGGKIENVTIFVWLSILFKQVDERGYLFFEIYNQNGKLY